MPTQRHEAASFPPQKTPWPWWEPAWWQAGWETLVFIISSQTVVTAEETGCGFGHCQHLLWCCCCFLRQNGNMQTCTGRMDPPKQGGCPGRRVAPPGWGFRQKPPSTLLPLQETLDKSLLLPIVAENSNYQQNNNHRCLPRAYCSRVVRLTLACIKQRG